MYSVLTGYRSNTWFAVSVLDNNHSILVYSREDSRKLLTEMKTNGSFLVRPKVGAVASSTEAVHTHTIDIM